MIKYEAWQPRQLGGQVVGTGPNGVKATHFIGEHPTGIEAFCEVHRSQHKNRQVAQEMVRWALAASKIEITADD